MKTDITVAPVQNRGRDLDDAAMVAARAFYDDPFFEYLIPRGTARARGLALFWRATIAGLTPDAQLHGARHAATGRLLGVAAVMPPGTYPLPVASQLRQLVGAVRSLILRPAALTIGPRYLIAIDQAHPKDPLWYLLLLVTDPSAQRSGIGSRLQEEMLDRADKDGLDCYLETQKPDNLVYYRRFGYEVDRELRPVATGPSLWTMRRSAR